VGVGQPDVEGGVVVPGGQPGEDVGDIRVFQLDVVPLLVEDGFPEFGGRDALVPAVEHGQGHVFLVFVSVADACVGRAASGQGEEPDGSDGQDGE
jgi:hypothetical protein